MIIGRNKGFTLIEMLSVLLIVSILAAMAMPAFDGFMNDSARRSQLININSAIQYARGEAISKSQQVQVCASVDGNTCSGVVTWDDGWIVFADVNGNGATDYGTFTCDADEDCLLKSYPALTRGGTLRSDAAQVTFNELGERDSGATTFTLCSVDSLLVNDPVDSHVITMNAAGATFVTLGSAVCP